jgi:hypothetical protein
VEATLEREQMAKSKGRPKTDRDEVTVKLDRALAQQAKLIAGRRGVTVGELLTDLLSGPISKAYLQLLRELEGRK